MPACHIRLHRGLSDRAKSILPAKCRYVCLIYDTGATSMDTTGLKYIVTGNLQSRFKDTFERILDTVVPKHGPFDGWFCTGNLFTPGMTKEDRDYIENVLLHKDLSLPLPIYLLNIGDYRGGDPLLERLKKAKVPRLLILDEKSGVQTLENGLTFGWISGIDEGSRPEEAKRTAKNINRVTFSQADVSPLLLGNQAAAIDLFFTYEWPRSIGEHSNKGLPGMQTIGSQLLDTVLAKFAPRYHFAIGERIFWEREPYELLNSTGDLVQICRFLSLADCLDAEKKWMYAMNLSSRQGPVNRPANLTLNPFRQKVTSLQASHFSPTSAITATSSTFSSITTPNYFFQVDSAMKKPLSDIEAAALNAARAGAPQAGGRKPPAGYVCKRCHDTKHFYRDCPFRVQPGDVEIPYICHKCHQPGHPIKSCPLWLETEQRALASSSNEGDPSLTDKRPREQIDGNRLKKLRANESACWFCLANPAIRKHLIIDIGEETYLTLARGYLTKEHFIIIPIEHIPSTEALPASTKTELLEKYIKRLQEHLHTKGMGLVTFGLYQHHNHHWHLQAIGIPLDRLSDLAPFAIKHSQKSGFQLVDAHPEAAHSRFEFTVYGDSDSSQATTLLCPIGEGAYFPAQLGRQILAEYLQIQDRSDWRQSESNEEEERSTVMQAKKALFGEG